MSSRHQPQQGADSADAYVLHTYEVLMVPDEGPAWWVRVAAALGPADAKQQARTAAHEAGEDASPTKVRQIEREVAA